MSVGGVRKVRWFANIDPPTQARVALMRFGLGPKLGVAARLAATDGAALRACLNEIYDPKALLIPDEEVTTYCTENKGDVALDYVNCCRFGATFRSFGSTGFLPQSPNVCDAECAIRYAKALEPEVGFAERLVQFWSNHFSVFRGKSVMVQATVGHLERNIIRKHALGKFSNLLKAVYTHPTMINYLDNQVSVGPNSPKARNDKSTDYACNENLAREILELHTLGIDAGYTQADIIAFAKILTGWTHYPGWTKGSPHPLAGQFYFEPAFHEPGPQTVLGVTYSQPDINQGLAVLDALAMHPATAQHISYKLIRHFVTDEPQPELVAYLAGIFRATGGDLQAMAKALVLLPQVWTEPMTRLVPPLQWQNAMLRGMGISRELMLKREMTDGVPTLPTLVGLNWSIMFTGQYVWGSVTPDGFTDENYFWMNANSVRILKDIAYLHAGYGMTNGQFVKPANDLIADLLPAPSANTRAVLAELAGKKKHEKSIVAALFASPEYILR